MVFVVFGFQDLSQINGQAKGGKATSMSPASATPLSLPPPSFFPSCVELFGVSVCVCLKNWRYLRAFVFSVSVESFWIYLLLFFLSLSCSSARFLCVHFVYFSRLVFCFFMLLLFSVVCFRDESCAGRPPISANTARCRRRGEAFVRRLRTVA